MQERSVRSFSRASKLARFSPPNAKPPDRIKSRRNICITSLMIHLELHGIENSPQDSLQRPPPRAAGRLLVLKEIRDSRAVRIRGRPRVGALVNAVYNLVVRPSLAHPARQN